MLRLKGGLGSSIGMNFADVSNETGFKKVECAMSSTPSWRSTKHGLCSEGTCTNSRCQANGKIVIMPIGYKKFDLVLDPSESTKILALKC
jgi:hypothetical protein